MLSAWDISEMVDKSNIVARFSAAERTGVRHQALVYKGPDEDDQPCLQKSRVEENLDGEQVFTHDIPNISLVS